MPTDSLRAALEAAKQRADALPDGIENADDVRRTTRWLRAARTEHPALINAMLAIEAAHCRTCSCTSCREVCMALDKLAAAFGVTPS